MAHPLKSFRNSQTPRLTQQAFAEMVGVKRGTVARWETGTRQIDTELLPAISEKTGIPKQELRPDLAEVMRESVE